MSSVIAAATSHGIWDSDTWGLIFTYGILMPALVTACIVVAKISGRGEKEFDDKLRGRWGRKPSPPSDS
jgi:Na+-translocating ferredoxin:NAD+ oxidoreductase RnfE subunit